MNVDLEAQKPAASRDEVSEKDVLAGHATTVNEPGREYSSAHGRGSPTAQGLHAGHRRVCISASAGTEEDLLNGFDAKEAPSPSRTSPRSPSHHARHRSSSSPGPLGTHARVPPAGSSKSASSSRSDDEEAGLFNFAEERPPGEPWFMEATRLRRLHFLWLNRELALIRKRILERKRASNEDMRALQRLLRDQAEAIRDFQYIRSLDFLSAGEMEHRRQRSIFWFPHTAHSADPAVFPFETENYRWLPRAKTSASFADGLRDLMRAYLPSRLTWTEAEKAQNMEGFREGAAPTTLRPALECVVIYAPPVVGALSILVPMYIMAIDQNQTKNLVTTTVAVVLFALLCSAVLRVSTDQTLSATVGYAAVLTVFVGLTTGKGNGH